MSVSNCKRCLLHETNQEELLATIRDYIESISDEIRTPPDLYEKRLAICKTCDNLVNGMCRLCGCFVEVRAAKKDNYCAEDREIW